MLRFPSAPVLTIATTLLLGLGSRPAHADTTVQVNLTGLLDGRSVTTLTNGQLVVWTVPTDGGGLQNAYMTAAGAMFKNQPVANALPNDGKFLADARHPEVVLNFSNDADAAAPQTHPVLPSGMFSFAVPAATYSKFFLFFSGAAGGTTVAVTFNYSDASTEVQNATIPDYFNDPTDPAVFMLASNLAKWDKTSKVTEKDHHNLCGAEFHPAPAKTLTGIKVVRGANGYLLFWGATGIATSEVPGSGGGGAGGAAGAGGASGASGSAGASGGVGGVGGAAGASAGAAGASAGSSGALSAGGSATAGAPAALAGAGPTVQNGAPEEKGCGCRLAAPSAPRTQAGWLVLGALGVWRLARARRRVRA